MPDYYDPFDSVARIIVSCFLIVAMALCVGVALAFGLTAHESEDLAQLMFWPCAGIIAFGIGLINLWLTEPVHYTRAGVEPTKPWSHGEE